MLRTNFRHLHQHSHHNQQHHPHYYHHNWNPIYWTYYYFFHWILLLLFIVIATSTTSVYGSEPINNMKFEIMENSPVGTLIGVVRIPTKKDQPMPRYLIMPHRSPSFDSDLEFDQRPGRIDIFSRKVFDREKVAKYECTVAVSDISIEVIIDVLDANDNAPQFPESVIHLEFPEHSKIGDVKRSLPPAIDSDLGINGTQKYRIVSGNIGDAFRLESHRKKDNILYHDLQVNGNLDRESIANYLLVIEALDGGIPPLRGELLVNITILDVNDNEPIFTQSRYYATVMQNLAIGSKILLVTATDADQGPNGRVEYSISSKVALEPLHFNINKDTGWIHLSEPVNYESKNSHELVVVARDCGAQPLETLAFVSIRIVVDELQPTISVTFFTDSGLPKISRHAKVGDLIAKVLLKIPDSPKQASSSSSSASSLGESSSPSFQAHLFGGDGFFRLNQSDLNSFFLFVNKSLLNETRSTFPLKVELLENSPFNFQKQISTAFQLDIVNATEAFLTSHSALNLSDQTGWYQWLPQWAILLIIVLSLITLALLIAIFVVRIHQYKNTHSPHQRTVLSGHNICQLVPGLDSIANSSSSQQYFLPSPVITPYAELTKGETTKINIDHKSIIKEHSRNTYLGTTTLNDDTKDFVNEGDGADEDLDMMNEGEDYYTYVNIDHFDRRIPTLAEYLTNLGVRDHFEDESQIGTQQNGSIRASMLRNSRLRGPINSFSSSSQRIDVNFPSKSHIMSSSDLWDDKASVNDELSDAYSWEYLADWVPQYQPIAMILEENLHSEANLIRGDDINRVNSSSRSVIGDIETASQMSSLARGSLHSHPIYESLTIPSGPKDSQSLRFNVSSAFRPFSGSLSALNSDPSQNEQIT
ncbi:uncharacterized protein LOC141856480 [Brevipalpus obovatus]|uniref:uncharacterized protein LOC141856480 n=1 Tax=Brevipalpus obovatus TaxID=246614 RepID=UPI003D9DFDAB